MTTCVIYTRLSQADADWNPGDGLTAVERQLADCKARAEREGWEVVGTYSDPDITASIRRRKRPGFEAMLADLGDGVRADTILCYKLDRLLRQPIETERLLDLADERGIGIVSVNDPALDLTTPTGRAMFRMTIVWAKLETETMGLRLKRKMSDLAEHGAPHGGGLRSFGLQPVIDKRTGKPAEPRRLEKVPAEVKLIREAADRVIAGESHRGISIDWKARGIVAPGGKPWQPAALNRMLRSPRLFGGRTHLGTVVASKGRIPAILDEQTWTRLQAALAAPRGPAGSRAVRVAFLAAIARCGLCGAKLQTHHRRGGPRKYACKSPRGCGRIVISATALESYVAEGIAIRLNSDAWSEAQMRQAERSRNGDVLAGLRADEAALEQASRDHYVDHLISRSEYLAAREPLEARIRTAKRDLAAGASTGLSDLAGSDIRLDWATNMDLEKRAWVARQMLTAVVVAPAKRPGATRLDDEAMAERVSLKWSDAP